MWPRPRPERVAAAVVRGFAAEAPAAASHMQPQRLQSPCSFLAHVALACHSGRVLSTIIRGGFREQRQPMAPSRKARISARVCISVREVPVRLPHLVTVEPLACLAAESAVRCSNTPRRCLPPAAQACCSAPARRAAACTQQCAAWGMLAAVMPRPASPRLVRCCRARPRWTTCVAGRWRGARSQQAANRVAAA